MQRMWSTWRTQYIESFKEKQKPSGCIFCNAAEQKPEDDASLLVHKDKNSFTVLNLYPYNNGHLMVVPNRHLSEYLELRDDEMLEVHHGLQRAVKALREIANPDGFNIGANLGKTAGAGIDDHIHFHIVPRWNGDTNFMPALGETKVLSQDLLYTKSLLIEAYEKILAAG